MPPRKSRARASSRIRSQGKKKSVAKKESSSTKSPQIAAPQRGLVKLTTARNIAYYLGLEVDSTSVAGKEQRATLRRILKQIRGIYRTVSQSSNTLLSDQPPEVIEQILDRIRADIPLIAENLDRNLTNAIQKYIAQYVYMLRCDARHGREKETKSRSQSVEILSDDRTPSSEPPDVAKPGKSTSSSLTARSSRTHKRKLSKSAPEVVAFLRSSKIPLEHLVSALVNAGVTDKQGLMTIAEYDRDNLAFFFDMIHYVDHEGATRPLTVIEKSTIRHKLQSLVQ